MPTCPHTGITIPECSCSACLKAQVQRNQPKVLESNGRATPRADGRRRGAAQRRAA
jgi:hypothetical protein